MGHNTLPLIITVQQITIRKCKVSITGTETSWTHCRLLQDMYVSVCGSGHGGGSIHLVYSGPLAGESTTTDMVAQIEWWGL